MATELKIGLLTRNENAWCSARIKKALRQRNATPVCFKFSDLVAKISFKPEVVAKNFNLITELSAVIVRPIGRGSLEECLFRLDVLHRIERLGVPIFNPPSAIEKAVDKYYALTKLEEHGIPVPRTVVTENASEALKVFPELGGDVIVKPIFGSRGIGMTRVSDPEVAARVFRTLEYYRHVIYIQEFVPHGTKDIRALVVGDHVIAAMYRVAENWKTNVSQGAKPVPHKLEEDMESLVVNAAKAIGCEIAGVDVIEGPNGPLVNEINSQPGFRGLQLTTKVDIAQKIVDHVISKARR